MIFMTIVLPAEVTCHEASRKDNLFVLFRQVQTQKSHWTLPNHLGMLRPYSPLILLSVSLILSSIDSTR